MAGKLHPAFVTYLRTLQEEARQRRNGSTLQEGGSGRRVLLQEGSGDVTRPLSEAELTRRFHEVGRRLVGPGDRNGERFIVHFAAGRNHPVSRLTSRQLDEQLIGARLSGAAANPRSLTEAEKIERGFESAFLGLAGNPTVARFAAQGRRR